MYEKLFLPCAVRGLELDRQKGNCLSYLAKFGSTREAAPVSQLLLKDKVTVEEVSGVLAFIAKIGGKDELDVLSTFIVKSIGGSDASVC